MREFAQSLADLSPTVAPLLEEVSQEADTLQGVVGDLMNQVQARQSDLGTLTNSVKEQISSLREKVAEEQSRLEQDVTDTEAKTEELRGAIETVKTNVIEGLEGAQERMTEFQGAIDQGRQTVETANEAVQGVIGTVQEHIQAGQHALHSAVDFGNQQVDVLRGEIENIKNVTEAKADELINNVEEGIRDTGARVEEMVGVSFADMGDMFGGAMEMLQGNVVENGVNSALDMLQEKIEGTVREILDSLTDQLIGMLGQVREGLFGDMDSAGLERKALEPILDQLDNIMDPLLSAFDYIKGIAAMVGIDVD